jgi:acetyltransferase-like isoleucine patch superfamily enzyme
MISNNATIYPNVKLGKNVVIEDYCIIGYPSEKDDKQTIIGDDAVIRSGTYIYSGNIIGSNFHTGNKVNIRENNKIGDNVSIGTLSVIEHSVQIFDGVRIHSQAFIPEFTILEKNCWIGPNVVLTNALYPQHPSVKNQLKGVHIKQNAKIGANVTILPGISIGENSLIGAGSVVTKNVEKDIIAAGNSAKMLRKVHY